MTTFDVPLSVPTVSTRNAHHPASVVGVSPWDDGSNDTYAEVWTCGDPTQVRADEAYATFDPITGVDITALTMSLTWGILNLNGVTTDRWSLSLWTPDFGERVFYLGTGDSASEITGGDGTTGHIFDDQFPTVVYADDTLTTVASWEDVTAYFAGGGIITGYRHLAFDESDLTFDARLRIYNLELHLEVSPATPPPCQLYPRDDVHGRSPSVYPPPRSRQSGNQPTGYY